MGCEGMGCEGIGVHLQEAGRGMGGGKGREGGWGDWMRVRENDYEPLR